MNRRINLALLILAIGMNCLQAQTGTMSANSQLLARLYTSDSLSWSENFLSFIKVDFNKEDLPYMHEALLRHYPDDSEFFNTRDRIANKMEGIADTSTVRFIRDHFPTLKGKDELIKYNFLEILATYKTANSYSVLKEMLLVHPPLLKQWNDLSFRITDSIELARTLYPEVLKLVNYSTLFAQIVSMTEELLDSNAIDLSMVRSHASGIMHAADSLLSWVKTQKAGDTYHGYEFVDLMRLLGRLGTNESNELLKRWLRVPETLIKQEAIIALLANNQVVAAAEIEVVAKDRLRRRDLYKKLGLLGRAELFPKQYLTQRMMADADMWTVASDEEEPPTDLVFVAERTANFKGKVSRFYLYRIVYRYPGEVTEYLGASGPYDIDKSKLDCDRDGTGGYFAKQYDKNKLSSQFNSLLSILSE